jgi:3-oxoadipate enol-lactonase
MAVADLGAVRLRYELSGDPALPVLVLSHALGVNHSMWEPQLGALGSHFRLLRIDTRGHGGSSIPRGPYKIADMSRDVIDLMDFLGIKQAGFCGLSMGGMIGQWLGIHANHRFNKLVLANTAARIGTVETWNARTAKVLRDGVESVVQGTMERWFTAGYRAAEPNVVTKTAATLQATSPRGYVDCCFALRDADFLGAIQDIRIPTLVISGSQDPVSPKEDIRFLVEHIPDAQQVELAAAHLSNVEAAVKFNDALLSFLTS